MLDKYRVSQIIALLNEGHGIKTVARMTGVSRNTVRRFQRNIPRKGHHGRAWRAMEAKLEDIRKLFYDCRGGSVKNFSHFKKMQMARQSVKVFVLT